MHIQLTVIAMTDDGCLWFSRTDDSGTDAMDIAVCTLIEDDSGYYSIWTAIVDAIGLIDKWCQCCVKR
ncbi:hypothetical protein LCGC14_1345780 [marine sediment metagenome]|uniref:Uncharacterized protein n=1 Tax=marine sediment metagenome TaxID=412755 RepID=A0A0F9KYG9_9ZZZZ